MGQFEMKLLSIRDRYKQKRSHFKNNSHLSPLPFIEYTFYHETRRVRTEQKRCREIDSASTGGIEPMMEGTCSIML